ncbi:nicotinate phosphoribosyltransferase [Corynebacterium sp. J010B-136]|uniref:nicotinate phosphoribosyltransferase n=1 Tax=Corynebacterium sp. J010B-136 TaxID=2099401 RepID=UPI0021019A02|nr:nicotinate phosphoribosyltransferase [Corynebacterium sp. J010B-136]
MNPQLNNSQSTAPSTALLTDMYELTMLQAALVDGTADRPVVCEVFARRLSNERRYGVVAGIPRVLEAVKNFRFTEEQLETLTFLDPTTLDYLRNYRFSGQIDGYREGELFFPNSPLLTVRGSFGECVLLETVILSIMNSDSAVASAASRMVVAADGRPIIEMGSRRTHEQAAVTAARAAYLAGFESTSNLEAAARYGIPASGTAAHSWTLAHVNDDGSANEKAAFKSQIEAHGVKTTLLVDTFDITQGVNNAIEVAGVELGGVRIDSGNLGAITRRVRKQLDDLGAHNTKIVVSSDLDEFAIAGLRGDPVDVYGVGTSVVTGSGAPTASMVYKIVEVDGHPVAKRSEAKKSVGGAKRALRSYRSSGVAIEEIIFPFDSEEPDTGHLSSKMLTVPLIRDGEIVDKQPSLDESREYLAHSIKTLPWEGLALTRDEPAVHTRYVGFE